MNRRENSQNNSNPINNSPNSRSQRNGRRNPRQTRLNRRNLRNRRNRRFQQAINRRRNRLARAQFVSRNNFQNRRRRFTFRPRTKMNLSLRKIFVGGLDKSINNRQLYNLFRRDGKILGWRVFYDRNGYSRGFGVLEFDRPRDAWKVIQKWNNTFLMGFKIRVEYKSSARRRMNRNRRRFNANTRPKRNNWINVNNRGFNYRKNNNYQNRIRNVNNNVYRNRSKFYYY